MLYPAATKPWSDSFILLQYMHRGADMTYIGMHTNIADSCAPDPNSCAPGPNSCAPDPDNRAPVYMMTKGRSCPAAQYSSLQRTMDL